MLRSPHRRETFWKMQTHIATIGMGKHACIMGTPPPLPVNVNTGSRQRRGFNTPRKVINPLLDESVYYLCGIHPSPPLHVSPIVAILNLHHFPAAYSPHVVPKWLRSRQGRRGCRSPCTSGSCHLAQPRKRCVTSSTVQVDVPRRSA